MNPTTHQATYAAIKELHDTTSLTVISSNTCLANSIIPQSSYIFKRVLLMYRSESNPIFKIKECMTPPSAANEQRPQALRTNGYVKLLARRPNFCNLQKYLTDSRGVELFATAFMIEFQAKIGGTMGMLSNIIFAQWTEIEQAHETK